MSNDDSSQGYFGQQGITDANSEYNRHTFNVLQELGQVRTHMAVKVMKVHPNTDDPISNGPTIDVMPMVNQIDGQGNATEHGMIYGIPITRSQGGDSVIINDPIVGDIGSMAIHDRDISQLKATSKQSVPGSFRRHDPADGVYHGPMLNKTSVKQYVMFSPNGVKIIDRNGNVVEMKNGSIAIMATTLAITGNLTVTGSITAGYGGSDSVTLQHHTHAHGPVPDAGT